MAIGGREFVMDFDDFPPSIKIDITISSPKEGIQEAIPLDKVLLDTGSDYTLIPSYIITSLELEPTGAERELILADDSTGITVKFYLARIIIENVIDDFFEVGSLDAEPLIGRNLINEFHLLINGINGTFEIANRDNYIQPNP